MKEGKSTPDGREARFHRSFSFSSDTRLPMTKTEAVERKLILRIVVDGLGKNVRGTDEEVVRDSHVVDARHRMLPKNQHTATT
jgi:hypothetical protein